MKIWKFPFSVPERNITCLIPKGGWVLKVGEDGSMGFLLVMVDPTQATEPQDFTLYSDDDDITNPDAPYAGSIYLKGRHWHLFEGKV